MSFLCDTNIISEMMKLSPEPHVEAWFSAQIIIRVSVITVEEIYFGLTYKQAERQRSWFERFLKFRGEILPITKPIARQCGVLRGKFRKQGIPRTQADMLIAATAKLHHLVLVTRNISDFEHCGLRLFNPFLTKEL